MNFYFGDFIKPGVFHWAMAILCAAVPILYILWMFASTFFDEIRTPGERWLKNRRMLVDRKQSKSVRACAEMLTKRKSADRIEGARILGELNDTTAVPALLRAIERYPDDLPFLMEIVRTLGKLGDPRAIPALRALTSGRHYLLMQAAKQVLATLEPQTVLLRAADSPATQAGSLLRASSASNPEEPKTLLRPDLSSRS